MGLWGEGGRGSFGGEKDLSRGEMNFFLERGSIGKGKMIFGWCEMAFLPGARPHRKRKKLSGYCSKSFLLERGSAGQGGRGDSDLPPMPPWTPYTPFKRPRDTPGPPLWRKGYFLLLLDRQGPYRARHLVWP